MSLAPALASLVLLVYAQSGMPGLGAFKLLFSLLKKHVACSVNRRDDGGRELAVAQPVGNESNKDFRSPISVGNDNVGEANVNIEINHYQHHHYYNEDDDDRSAMSDGGSKRQ